MGPFPHDAPPATITADNPMGTDGFEFVEYAHPHPQELHALFKLMGYAPVARHKTRAITVYRQGDINYLVNEQPGTHGFDFVAEHGPCAPSMAFRVVDAKAAYARAIALGAEPADLSSAQKTLDVPAIKGIGGSLLYFVDRYGAKGSAYDAEFEWLGARDPRPAGAGLFYLDHLTHNVHRGRMDVWTGFGPVLAGADQPGRQDPDSDQRGRRRFRPDRGIFAHLSRRGHPAHRLRLPRHLQHDRRPARSRPAVHAGAARHLFRADRRKAAEAWRGRCAASEQWLPDRRRRRRRGRPDQGAAPDLLRQCDRPDLLRVH